MSGHVGVRQLQGLAYDLGRFRAFEFAPFEATGGFRALYTALLLHFVVVVPECSAKHTDQCAAEAVAEANMLTAKSAARMIPATLNKDFAFMLYLLLHLGLETIPSTLFEQRYSRIGYYCQHTASPRTTERNAIKSLS